MSSSTQNSPKAATTSSNPNQSQFPSNSQQSDEIAEGSGGSERGQVDVESSEFRSWFAGSRVVNGLGEPFVCYYGTASDSKTIGKRGNGTYAQMGYWFDSVPRLVESYGLDHSNKHSPHLIPAYLSIRNPKEYSSMESLRDAIDAKFGLNFKARLQNLHKLLIRARHDGVVVRNGQEMGGAISDYWVAFRNKQIRVMSGL
jgi:hypothetical protein